MLAVLSLFLFHAERAQAGPIEEIANALKSGDAASVSRYFGPSVDISINNSLSTYSRTQGEQVLRDFFNKNAVRDFSVEQSGNSSASPVTFTIGYMTTGSGRYKIYMWLRPKDGGYVLREIRFEKLG